MATDGMYLLRMVEKIEEKLDKVREDVAAIRAAQVGLLGNLDKLSESLLTVDDDDDDDDSEVSELVGLVKARVLAELTRGEDD